MNKDTVGRIGYEASKKHKNYHIKVEKDGVEISFEEGKDGFVGIRVWGKYFTHDLKVYPQKDGKEAIVDYARFNPRNKDTWQKREVIK